MANWKLTDVVGVSPVKFIEGNPSEWLAPSLPVGIEIELENVRNPGGLHESLDFGFVWTQHQEHSLRNAGAEFVFVQPLPLSNTAAVVHDFCAKAAKMKCDPSWRAGIHVHIQAIDMEPEELERFFQLYSLYEGVLFEWADANRAKTRFCKPWYSTIEHVLPFINALQSNKKPSRLQAISEEMRYSALNVAALWKYGTVEFRHLPSTLDPERLLIWLHLIDCIYHTARASKITPEEFISSVDSMGIDRFTDLVFGKYASELRVYKYPEKIRLGRYTVMKLRGASCGPMKKSEAVAGQTWEQLAVTPIMENEFVRRFKTRAARVRKRRTA